MTYFIKTSDLDHFDILFLRRLCSNKALIPLYGSLRNNGQKVNTILHNLSHILRNV